MQINAKDHEKESNNIKSYIGGHEDMTYFKQSFTLKQELQNKLTTECKTLPVLDRLRLAEECQKEAKDRKEYDHITKVIKDLENEYRAEIKFGTTQVDLFSEEELTKFDDTVEKEVKAAEKKFTELKKRANELQDSVFDELEQISDEIIEIREQYGKLVHELHSTKYNVHDAKYAAQNVLESNRIRLLEPHNIKQGNDSYTYLRKTGVIK